MIPNNKDKPDISGLGYALVKGLIFLRIIDSMRKYDQFVCRTVKTVHVDLQL
jgi:hypothetical protein